VARAGRNTPQAQCTVIAQHVGREVTRLVTSLPAFCVITCTRASGNLYPHKQLNGAQRSARKGKNAMPFVPAPNIVELQFRYTNAGEQTENRIHLDVGATPTALDLANINEAAAEWYTGNMPDLQPTSLVLREIYSKSLETQPGPEATYTAGLPIPGTSAFQALPSNASLAVSLRSGETGRSARGRWYWQQLAENQVDTNLVTTGAQADILAAMQNLKNAMTDVSATWVIVSYRHNNAPRVGGPVYFTVNSIILVDNVVDSQRRRLPGRGR